ncbi:TPA: hypothetical protein QCJ85_004402 [Enterobacter asburiae]|nr:hypothetical protein [Enterobacter asburiae]HDR2817372.1 hypothetical protein [Enterobacter asburiae]
MKIPKSWGWRGKKRHLVSEIQDGDVALIVYKVWSPGKQRWKYYTEPKSVIEYELSLIKRDNK